MTTVTPIPWRMWYGPEQLALDWPDGWDVRVCAMPDAPALDDTGLRARLDDPIGTPPLAELARGRRDACILVDDLTRPTPAARIVPELLRTLEQAGLPSGSVRLLVANAAHAPLEGARLVRKLGADLVRRCRTATHDLHGDLVEVGGVPGIGTIELSRAFYEADLKLAVTGVTAHFMCGFSGGAKIVMPGACGFETVRRTHEHTVAGPPARVGVVEGNAMRAIMEHCAHAAGLEFCVNCVFNARGELSALYCGEPTESHWAAVSHAQRAYATVPAFGTDVAVFNAFPKDTEFIQAMAALNVWADRTDPARALVRPGGTIIVICAASEGLGRHGLIQQGGPHFVRRDLHGSFRDVLAGRELLFLAPGVDDGTAHVYYPPRARRFDSWPPLRATLEGLHPHGARAGVYPSSALQLHQN